MSIFNDIPTLIKDNFLYILAFLYIVSKIFTPSSPHVEFEGSIVTNIQSLEEWDEILVASKKDADKLYIVDAYATWCPPCKAASPIYGRMSIEYDKKSIEFFKFDVDKVPNVSKKLAITAMPSFKLFKGGKEIDQLTGWRESSLRTMIEKHGAIRISSCEKTS
jgi:thioredoxin 1